MATQYEAFQLIDSMNDGVLVSGQTPATKHAYLLSDHATDQGTYVQVYEVGATGTYIISYNPSTYGDAVVVLHFTTAGTSTLAGDLNICRVFNAPLIQNSDLQFWVISSTVSGSPNAGAIGIFTPSNQTLVTDKPFFGWTKESSGSSLQYDGTNWKVAGSFTTYTAQTSYMVGLFGNYSDGTNVIAIKSYAPLGINATNFTGVFDAAVLANVVNKTLTELTAVPASTASLEDKINWLFALAKNKITQDATTQTLFANNSSTPISTAAVSDDGTTFTRAKFA